MKKIVYGVEARESLSNGVQRLTDAVQVTMGPLGRNVLIQRENEQPFLTKDGVTVAGEVELEDPLENMAAQLVKEVSSNTAFEAGDGTTTSTVLTNAIFQAGLPKVNAGCNVVEMKRGMDEAVLDIEAVLKEQAIEITSNDQIKQIATISANGDEVMGKMIAEAMEQVGSDGIISIEENNGVTDEVILTKGLKINRGYMSPNFVTNPAKETAELDNPLILMTDQRVGHLAHLLPILEQVQKTARPLLIIADDFDHEALQTVVVNKVRGIMNITVVKSPGFGDGKREQMLDIAAVVGATIIGAETGKTFEGCTIADLGQAKRIVVEKQTSNIIDGYGEERIVQALRNNLKAQIGNLPDGDAKVSLQSRLSRISGGAAVIRVGAQTELEMKEKKDRFDDAVAATKAATVEGIVMGGGSALLKIGNKFQIPTEKGSKDFIQGYYIVLEAIQAPFRQIVKNAGYENVEEIVTEVLALDPTFGFNALANQYQDMFDVGIIDPVKVTRIALINAVSCAGTLLTTETAILPVSK